MSENIHEEIDLNDILKARREKLAALQQAGRDPYCETIFYVQKHTKEIVENFDKLEGTDTSVAGRIMSKRGMGKVIFADLQDRDGRIQLYIKADEIGDGYEDIKKLDLGDIVGVEGEVFRTQRGEISIKAKSVKLLSKSLQPLPEKFHGLKDTDLRYRMRYLDLIVNPEVRETFLMRSEIIREIRKYLDNKGFLEVDTPILNTIPGGAAARPFITHHNTLDIDMYLRIATELHLKRLIVGGFEKVYELGRIFRNEGMSVKHNPEFTTVELYQAYTDYEGMMRITEDLFVEVTKSVRGTLKISYQGTDVDLTPPWDRMTMIEAVKKFAGVDFGAVSTDKEAAALAKSVHVEIKEGATWGSILNEVFEEKVEENLVQPTFITEYPVEVSPLAKRKKDDPRLTERFELFITSRELANAFTELNDPIDQKARFEDQATALAAGNEEANMPDDDFVLALEYAMPPTGGMGFGVDRFVMLLTDSASIRDVLLFPTMKPME